MTKQSGQLRQTATVGGGEVLFIGCAGVGKTSVAAEIHAQFVAARIRHCLIEGDKLDLAWTAPWEQGLGLAEANLTAMWRAYQAPGMRAKFSQHRRCVPRCDGPSSGGARRRSRSSCRTPAGQHTETVTSRLAQREIGSALESHVKRSQRAAFESDVAAPAWVRRVDTNRRSVAEVARSVQNMVDWPPLAEDL